MDPVDQAIAASDQPQQPMVGNVTIASTGAPFYEPNTQTGGPITHFVTDPGIAAINTIWHDAEHASRVILPVVK